ncbi:hypothetical protein H6P81_002887 [Aristolochia fimbriata]|uniref:Uncharacterized protein n=1 Tax=Aristolochia fimbriata TaxID=158543 RepID=A0AAV7FCT5_ARIFI|nr:hypothetical protein H6P81_002887 [Aristolochia fimbriata]
MAYLTLFEDFQTTGRYSREGQRLPSSIGNSRRRVTLKWSALLDASPLYRTPLICFEIVEIHVPDRVMLQFGLEQLGYVQNVIERVQRRKAMDPSLADPYMMEIGHYCKSILHSLSLLEGTIVRGEMSHGGEPSHVVEPTRDRAQRGRRARRLPTSETTLRIEDPDELPVVPEPTVQDLPPVQTPEPEPEQPPEP